LIPLYKEVAESIKSLIINGKWKIGERIPGDFQLMKDYNVSRDTVRKAIRLLVDDGYLIRRPGRGTFVCRKRKSDFMEQLISFTSEMIARGYVPSAKLISFEEIRAPAEIADKLDCDQKDKVYYIERIRYVNNIPVAHEKSYLLKAVVGNLKKQDIEDSMYEFLAYKIGITFTRMIQEIKPMILDTKLAKLMGVDVMPVLNLTRTIFTKKNRPFYYLSFIFRGDIYSVRNELKF